MQPTTIYLGAMQPRSLFSSYRLVSDENVLFAVQVHTPFYSASL
jgi:hypothetical protein